MNPLPDQFCWTRYGTEASQTIDQILLRKEQERLANNGIFFWGIGNAIGPSMKELLRQTDEPEVLFSPIKSKPRSADVDPPGVAVWASARGILGDFFHLPEQSLITSRFDPARPRSAHYALVCYSAVPLVFERSELTLNLDRLRNLLTGRSVGASQTTAVVSQHGSGNSARSLYSVSFRVKLTAPYLIRLSDPIPLQRHDECFSRPSAWADSVKHVWETRPKVQEEQLDLQVV